MTFDAALRTTEILLALAIIQQSLEHMATPSQRRSFYLLRAALCIALLLGVYTNWALGGMAALSLIYLHRFQGPYNGGSDKMTILITWCLLLVHVMPNRELQQVVFGYLAVQLVLSYCVSGWVKVINPQWRSGQALGDVFAFSAYPVSEEFRNLANLPTLCLVMSWAVILFELLFAISLVHQSTLIAALVIAAAFHLVNACLFGLNRFFWIWLTAYPSLIWFQQHIVAPLLWNL